MSKTTLIAIALAAGITLTGAKSLLTSTDAGAAGQPSAEAPAEINLQHRLVQPDHLPIVKADLS